MFQRFRHCAPGLTACLLALGLVSAAQAQDVPNVAKHTPSPLARLIAKAPAGGKLLIGGRPMVETPENYHAYIKYLTVAPARQSLPAFTSGDAETVRALESRVRRQSFDAMNKNRVGVFRFASLQQARENFAMRYAAIGFMHEMKKGRAGRVDFGYYERGKVPAEADARHWAQVGNFGFKTLPGKLADDAIDAIVRSRFRGECRGAIEVAILHAAHKALGGARFNALHPNGLGVALDGGDAARHKQRVPLISVADMVPGDWVYMENKDDYAGPGGYWAGENGLYMGRYEVDGNGTPRYRGDAPQRFSGMGVYDHTEDEMRQTLKANYLRDLRRFHPGRVYTITDAEVRWTGLSRLVTGD